MHGEIDSMVDPRLEGNYPRELFVTCGSGSEVGIIQTKRSADDEGKLRVPSSERGFSFL